MLALLLLPWIKAFAFTQLIEAPIYRRLAPIGWAPALGASAITHPFVWFFFPWLGAKLDLAWTTTATASEVFAWGLEAIFVRAISWRTVGWGRACLVSLVANSASLGLGLLFRELTGWI